MFKTEESERRGVLAKLLSEFSTEVDKETEELKKLSNEIAIIKTKIGVFTKVCENAIAA